MGGFGYSAFNAQQDRANAVAADAENATRAANFACSYQTSGVGYIVVPDVVPFDVIFVDEPHFATGVSIVTPPDTKWWYYPQVTAGVYRWRKDPKSGYYTGAYFYFTVKCDANPQVGSNADAITALSSQHAALDAERTAVQNGAPAYRSADTLTQLMGQLSSRINSLDAQDTEEPPIAAHVVLMHHIVFTGTAMKDLSDVVAQTSQGVEPRLVTFSATPGGQGELRDITP